MSDKCRDCNDTGGFEGIPATQCPSCGRWCPDCVTPPSTTMEDYLYIEIKRVKAKRDYLSGLISENNATMMYDAELESLLQSLRRLTAGED